jgi:hypothetical protein
MFIMRRTMTKNGMEGELNGWMTLLHIVSVSMYIAVGVLIYINIFKEAFPSLKSNPEGYLILGVFDQLMQAIA